ncbi:hypothetical protein SDC9_68639 [bioreactor metagenome]|uniref:Uncharacterized protein n=1 Tax=bioreactor metagenome TaxID=1076179 RepID=A0A644Y2E2_9ZZZZ
MWEDSPEIMEDILQRRNLYYLGEENYLKLQIGVQDIEMWISQDINMQVFMM